MPNTQNDLRKYTTRNLIVTHWMEKLDTAFGLMTKNSIRHLPVVDDAGAIIGLISERDFQRAMQIDQPDFTSGKVAHAEFEPNARVRDFMSWPVAAIDEKSTIQQAARMMVDRRISSLVVTRKDEVVGIVTTEDMLRSLLEGSEGLFSQLKSDVSAVFYNSTIGQIANALANAGI